MLQELKRKTVDRIIQHCDNNQKYQVAVLINGLTDDELAALQALAWFGEEGRNNERIPFELLLCDAREEIGTGAARSRLCGRFPSLSGNLSRGLQLMDTEFPDAMATWSSGVIQNDVNLSTATSRSSTIGIS